MILLLGLLSVLWGEPGLCLKEDGGFTFDGDLRQFAVASNSVYVATEERLYQLSHDLTLINNLTQRGILKTGNQTDDVQFYRVSETAAWNSTFSINVLLPFSKSDSLISCGVTDDNCGYCEFLDLKNISNLPYSEHIQVGPSKRSSASVSFLVDVKKKKTQTDTYILTAIQQNKDQPANKCGIYQETITLQDTDDKQGGGLFSITDGASGTPSIKSKGDVQFVDGFQINSTIYLFFNALSDQTNRVRLIWLQGERSKTDALKSLRGATLSISDSQSSRLVASSVIPGEQPVLWSGVFSVDGGDTNTELIVFDISADNSRETDKDPDFYTSAPSSVPPKILKPKAVLFRHSSMTSVLAVRQRAWIVFFIGTGDGQLIKLPVDRNYHAACPTVLYRTDDDRKVFPKLLLDPVDHKHVYVPFRNQMKRVPVSECSAYTNVQECWSAQDPFCVWCGSKRSCTFEGECTDSDWFSGPDDSQKKMISHKLEKDTNGQISLKIHAHLTVGQTAGANFACQFPATSKQLCGQNNPRPLFPQCTCVLSDGVLTRDGISATVRFRLGTTFLSEVLALTDCSGISGPPSSALCQRCIKAGCGWSKNGCSWANHGVTDDRECQKLKSAMSFLIPEISSITPSVVSLYGRNNAELSGRNLSDVTKVKFYVNTDCMPKIVHVWNNTGVSVKFHIPSSDIKGVVNVCVLLPDGSCHGEAKITYSSSPSCSSVSPSSSWSSGKRRITVTGSHLVLVKGVVHSHAMQDVRNPTNSSDQTLTYDTPAAGKISSSTVLLKAANQTWACPTNIHYYPDPEFTGFTAATIGRSVRVVLLKKADKLGMTIDELSVRGVQGTKEYFCIMERKESIEETDYFSCAIQNLRNPEIDHLLINYGNKTVSLSNSTSLRALLIVIFLLIILLMAVFLIIYLWRQRRRTHVNGL